MTATFHGAPCCAPIRGSSSSISVRRSLSLDIRSIRSPGTLSGFGVLTRGGQGKHDAKGRAAPGSRRDHDSASEATGHKVVDDVQSQASATLAAAGREEGVERPALHLLGHALAVVIEIDLDLTDADRAGLDVDRSLREPVEAVLHG